MQIAFFRVHRSFDKLKQVFNILLKINLLHFQRINDHVINTFLQQFVCFIFFDDKKVIFMRVILLKQLHGDPTKNQFTCSRLCLN